jgi:hypothetical protein
MNSMANSMQSISNGWMKFKNWNEKMENLGLDANLSFWGRHFITFCEVVDIMKSVA